MLGKFGGDRKEGLGWLDMEKGLRSVYEEGLLEGLVETGGWLRLRVGVRLNGCTS